MQPAPILIAWSQITVVLLVFKIVCTSRYVRTVEKCGRKNKIGYQVIQVRSVHVVTRYTKINMWYNVLISGKV